MAAGTVASLAANPVAGFAYQVGEVDALPLGARSRCNAASVSSGVRLTQLSGNDFSPMVRHPSHTSIVCLAV